MRTEPFSWRCPHSLLANLECAAPSPAQTQPARPRMEPPAAKVFPRRTFEYLPPHFCLRTVIKLLRILRNSSSAPVASFETNLINREYTCGFLRAYQHSSFYLVL